MTVRGGQEAIRCRARDTPAGDGTVLAIDVNYASDSDRVTIVSTVVVQGTIVSRSWQETTRPISGDVSGSVPDPTTDQAGLQTLGGGLQIGARSNGRRRSIVITSQGSEAQGASITSSRR